MCLFFPFDDFCLARILGADGNQDSNVRGDEDSAMILDLSAGEKLVCFPTLSNFPKGLIFHL